MTAGATDLGYLRHRMATIAAVPFNHAAAMATRIRLTDHHRIIKSTAVDGTATTTIFHNVVYQILVVPVTAALVLVTMGLRASTLQTTLETLQVHTVTTGLEAKTNIKANFGESISLHNRRLI